MKKWILAATLCCVLVGHNQAQTGRELIGRENVARIHAKVTELWVRDARYESFHAELAKLFPDTPALAGFVADEQWLVVMSTTSIKHPGIYKARSKASLDVQFGDIVEVRVADFAKVKTYAELSEVTRVICRATASGFEECAKNNPYAWFDAAGAPVPLQK